MDEKNIRALTPKNNLIFFYSLQFLSSSLDTEAAVKRCS